MSLPGWGREATPTLLSVIHLWEPVPAHSPVHGHRAEITETLKIFGQFDRSGRSQCGGRSHCGGRSYCRGRSQCEEGTSAPPHGQSSANGHAASAGPEGAWLVSSLPFSHRDSGCRLKFVPFNLQLFHHHVFDTLGSCSPRRPDHR